MLLSIPSPIELNSYILGETSCFKNILMTNSKFNLCVHQTASSQLENFILNKLFLMLQCNTHGIGFILFTHIQGVQKVRS